MTSMLYVPCAADMTSHENTLMDVGSAMSSVTLLKHAHGQGSSMVRAWSSVYTIAVMVGTTVVGAHTVI